MSARDVAIQYPATISRLLGLGDCEMFSNMKPATTPGLACLGYSYPVILHAKDFLTFCLSVRGRSSFHTLYCAIAIGMGSHIVSPNV